jgi:predicted phage replisome organizer
MMNKRYYWLKLKESFFIEPKIKKLRKIAGGDTYTVIFQKIMLLSIKNHGVITYQGLESKLSNELALIMDEDEDNVEVTIEFMLRTGLLEQIKDNQFLVTSVPELIGSESESAARVRKCRGNKKDDEQPKALQCNTPVTDMKHERNQNVTTDIRDKRKDKDIDKRKNIKKEKSYLDLLDQSIHELFEEFLTLRKQLKAKNTDQAINLLISKLKNHSVKDQKKMLEDSIMNSWKSVFTPKNQGNQKPLQPSIIQPNNPDWRMSDDELKAHNEAVMKELFGAKLQANGGVA